MFASPVVDVAELGVSVRMLLALGDLGVRLEAVAQVVQEIADEVCPDLVAEPGELGSEDPRRRTGPSARSFAPAISVLRLIPAASATRAWPPRPSTSTIEAASSRRWRSSRNGDVSEKNRDRPSSASSTSACYIARLVIARILTTQGSLGGQAAGTVNGGTGITDTAHVSGVLPAGASLSSTLYSLSDASCTSPVRAALSMSPNTSDGPGYWSTSPVLMPAGSYQWVAQITSASGATIAQGPCDDASETSNVATADSGGGGNSHGPTILSADVPVTG